MQDCFLSGVLGKDAEIGDAFAIIIFPIIFRLDGFVINGKVFLHPDIQETVLVRVFDLDGIILLKIIQEPVILVGSELKVGDACNDIFFHRTWFIIDFHPETPINAPSRPPRITDPPERYAIILAPPHNFDRMPANIERNVGACGINTIIHRIKRIKIIKQVHDSRNGSILVNVITDGGGNVLIVLDVVDETHVIMDEWDCHHLVVDDGMFPTQFFIVPHNVRTTPRGILFVEQEEEILTPDLFCRRRVQERCPAIKGKIQQFVLLFERINEDIGETIVRCCSRRIKKTPTRNEVVSITRELGLVDLLQL